VLQHRDELSKFIGDEISKTMAEQKALERRYEALIEQRAAMKGMVNKHKYKEVQEEIQEVSRSLKETTNTLVRNLKENPNVSGNMLKVQRDRTEFHDLLLRCTQELRDRGMYHTISHKVDEENNARTRFQQLKTREKALRETVVKLQEQLTEEQRNYQRISTEQRNAIIQLKDELQLVKVSTSTDAKFKRKESLATVSAIWREFKHRERQLEAKLKELEDKLQTEQLVNSETKEFLARKQRLLLDDVAKWEAKYESDVGGMDEEIRKISTKRTTLLENLTILRTRKEIERKEEKRQSELKALELDMAKEKKSLLKRQNKAARTIQKTMRNYVKRKKELDAIKAAGKGKGKGGGKGGGKKGKKK
jgi:IQ domain-containing protein G